ncbi:hypothetical protein HOC35_02800 [Candidatus Woesearchaeota archaeon]|jgi:hypothetical protein|nr:hypothetical protein [Candidatus Woesearchaeota archaeon]
MSNESKITVGGAEANFLKAMLKSAEEKYTDPLPNSAAEDPNEIEKLTKELQSKWAIKK